jgi:hypothetical protein
MSLRGRVGQHGVGGRQCQNWVEDQQLVIDVLNQIPVIKGGAGGSLRGRIVLGIASHALHLAILRFEDKYFPGQRSGFIDPNGKMWGRMLDLMPNHPLTFRMTQVFVTSFSLGDSHGD